jgi:hypothetical protein
VARRAKETAREAIRILKRARDVAQLSAEAATDLAHLVQDCGGDGVAGPPGSPRYGPRGPVGARVGSRLEETSRLCHFPQELPGERDGRYHLMRVHRLRVARRAKGTPREAIRILQRARDVAQLSAAAATDLAHVVQGGAPAIGLAHVVQGGK